MNTVQYNVILHDVSLHYHNQWPMADDAVLFIAKSLANVLDLQISFPCPPTQGPAAEVPLRGAVRPERHLAARVRLRPVCVRRVQHHRWQPWCLHQRTQSSSYDYRNPERPTGI